MLRLLATLLIACPALWGQGLEITAEAGISGTVAPPFTELRIVIDKQQLAPFVGRISAEIDESGSGRGGMSARFVLTQDINLEEGAFTRTVRMEVPVPSTSGASVGLVVRLERQVSGDYYEAEAIAPISMVTVAVRGRLVGFVSDARLAEPRGAFPHMLVEIARADLPESWKPLSGFDAIILNDDQISRAQTIALADYLTMGGTVLLSPRSNASFNPETLAGSLLRIAASARPRTVLLSEYPQLLEPVTHAGARAEAQNSERTIFGPDGATTRLNPLSSIPVPAAGANFLYWPDGGRAHPLRQAHGLAGVATVGAGRLVLLQVNIADPPFQQGGKPTIACFNLLELAMAGVEHRLGLTPTAALADEKIRNHIDIAGRRIPGPEVLVLALLVYVSAAGVGMFLFARRIRRPELYPATLLAVALLSVGLVFGVGELVKRGGDRVVVARVLVSDDASGRAAVFTIGCSYAVQRDELSYRQARDSMMVPARMGRGRIRAPLGVDNMHAFTVQFTPTETLTRVRELDRWQNVFLLHGQPSAPDGMNVRFESLESAWRVTNLSRHRLQGCVLVVGGPETSPGIARCGWFYTASLEARGREGDSFTFSDSARVKESDTPVRYSAEVLSRYLKRDLSDSRAFALLATLLKINPQDRLQSARELHEVETSMAGSGLLPEDGEVALICVLPPDALASSDIGAEGVDESDIGQVNLWVVRGALR